MITTIGLILILNTTMVLLNTTVFMISGATIMKEVNKRQG